MGSFADSDSPRNGRRQDLPPTGSWVPTGLGFLGHRNYADRPAAQSCGSSRFAERQTPCADRSIEVLSFGVDADAQDRRMIPVDPHTRRRISRTEAAADLRNDGGQYRLYGKPVAVYSEDHYLSIVDSRAPVRAVSSQNLLSATITSGNDSLTLYAADRAPAD
jgi:hypothetical protein